MKVLIIEDQEEMRSIYSDYLGKEFEEIQITFSNDGIDGFVRCNTFQFDVIILDHEMPRMKGLDLLVSIRNTVGMNQFTQIIFISGKIDLAKKQFDLFKNVTILNKPFEFDQLGAILSEISTVIGAEKRIEI